MTFDGFEETLQGYMQTFEDTYEIEPEHYDSFFLIHANTNKLIRYEGPVVDKTEVSPNSLLNWAQTEALTLDMAKVTEEISETQQRTDLSDEEKEQTLKEL